jgi:hypothetical protein
MFVTSGARAKLRGRRRDQFAERFLRPLIVEADKLGLSSSELKELLDKWGVDQ